MSAGEPARKLSRSVEVIGPPECPLMFRRTIVSNRFCKLLLHEFLPGATDKDAHDHPRSFLTLVYQGGYDDVQPDGTLDVVRAPTLRYRRAEHAHVTRVHRDGCRTLVAMGPLRREWGFWRDGSWLPWRTHELRYGLAFRCDDPERSPR